MLEERPALCSIHPSCVWSVLQLHERLLEPNGMDRGQQSTPFVLSVSIKRCKSHGFHRRSQQSNNVQQYLVHRQQNNACLMTLHKFVVYLLFCMQAIVSTGYVLLHNTLISTQLKLVHINTNNPTTFPICDKECAKLGSETGQASNYVGKHIEPAMHTCMHVYNTVVRYAMH